AVRREPCKVCSMNCSAEFAVHGSSSRFAAEQMTCVEESIGARIPARVLPLLASRAVSWNPHRRWAGSLTVTRIRCFTPGEYDVPPASIVTLPWPRLSPAPAWQPASAQVDSPGAPDLPGSGPAE